MAPTPWKKTSSYVLWWKMIQHTTASFWTWSEVHSSNPEKRNLINVTCVNSPYFPRLSLVAHWLFRWIALSTAARKDAHDRERLSSCRCNPRCAAAERIHHIYCPGDLGSKQSGGCQCPSRRPQPENTGKIERLLIVLCDGKRNIT